MNFIRMTTKLTLSLDDKIIERAKRYSQKKGKSLSKVVEEYFRQLTDEPSDKKKRTSILELKGIGGKVPPDFNYRDARDEYLMEKYK